MNGCVWLLAVSALGVEYGWQPTEEGELEYIIQIEPELLKSLADGAQIISEIHPDVRNVRRFRIQVGKGQLPREGADPRVNPAARPPNNLGGAGSSRNAADSQPLLPSSFNQGGNSVQQQDPRTDSQQNRFDPVTGRPLSASGGAAPTGVQESRFTDANEPRPWQDSRYTGTSAANSQTQNGNSAATNNSPWNREIPAINPPPLQPANNSQNPQLGPVTGYNPDNSGFTNQNGQQPNSNSPYNPGGFTPVSNGNSYDNRFVATPPFPGNNPTAGNNPQQNNQNPGYTPPYTGPQIPQQQPPQNYLPAGQQPPSGILASNQPNLGIGFQPTGNNPQNPTGLGQAPFNPALGVNNPGVNVSLQSNGNEKPEQAWWPLMLTLVALFFSLGGNLYLGWMALEFYSRYRNLAEDMRRAEVSLV